MVVCKCRKATRLYCFVHKVPVCGECICFDEHQICVVKNYSDWVVDAEYDWPPLCSLCHAVLEARNDYQIVRLGCLHLMHASCLVSHIQSFPSQTASSEYMCPICSSPLWPPKSIKDTGSRFYSKLKAAVIQSGMEKNVFGNHVVSMSTVESRVPPPAFSSDALMSISGAIEREKSGTDTYDSVKDSRPAAIDIGSLKISEAESIEIDGPDPAGSQGHDFMKNTSPKVAGATTRKGTYHVDRQNPEVSDYLDEDGTRNKYTRRGPFRHKFLRLLLPFWSSSLPTLPVTAPPRKDRINDDVLEGRSRRPRSSKMDPRKILLAMAIMACMATMGILYYRLALGNLGEKMGQDFLVNDITTNA